MTLFGLIWMILTVLCFFTSIENIAVLTIISSVIQCSNVVVIGGVGIGPQIITSLVFVVRIFIQKNLSTFKLRISKEILLEELSVVMLFAIVITSSVLNAVITFNYMRVVQLFAYMLCFFFMLSAGSYVKPDFTYNLIRKLTIALLVIGVVQLGVTSGTLPRLSIISHFLYNDTTSNVIYFTRNNYNRILSTYMEPSYYAGFLVGAFYYFLMFKERRNKNLWLLGAILSEIILTFSSSAYGAFFVMGILFLASTKEKKLKATILVGGLLGFLVMYFLFFDILDAVVFSKASSGSAAARRSWNIAAIRKFYESPIVGVGYKQSRASSIVYTILSELGILGMVSWVTMNISILLPAMKKKNRNNEDKGLRFAIISVAMTQLIAVPDLDICTYWMWMNLFALNYACSKRRSHATKYVSEAIY